ncbi:hypothetical protein RCL1_002770 [Eukaryota sp. TZLM3-RCL]
MAQSSYSPYQSLPVNDPMKDIGPEDIFFDPTDCDELQRARNAYAGFEIDEVILLVAAVQKYVKVARSHRVNWVTVSDGLGEGWTPVRAQLIWRFIAYPHRRPILDITPRGIIDGPEDGVFVVNHEDSDWDGSGCRAQKVERVSQPKKRSRKASEAFDESSPPSPEVDSVVPYHPGVVGHPPALGFDEGLGFGSEVGFLGDNSSSMWSQF